MAQSCSSKSWCALFGSRRPGSPINSWDAGTLSSLFDDNALPLSNNVWFLILMHHNEYLLMHHNEYFSAGSLPCCPSLNVKLFVFEREGGWQAFEVQRVTMANVCWCCVPLSWMASTCNTRKQCSGWPGDGSPHFKNLLPCILTRSTPTTRPRRATGSRWLWWSRDQTILRCYKSFAPSRHVPYC